MDTTRFEMDFQDFEVECRPMSAAVALDELATLGIACDAESFRALAGALGEPYRIADAWRRLAPQPPASDCFNVYAVVLWLEVCPGRPCGDLAVVELANLSFREEDMGQEEFLREAVSRTIELGRLAFEVQPDAPGEWLRGLVDACAGWDVLGWVVGLILRLHRLRRRSPALAICRAWMPLFRDLWRREPLLAEFPCLCLSGSPLVACCGRWGRG
ncbi:MAG: hypothetical protein AAB434_03015 [Planctomycetota bacterium]